MYSQTYVSPWAQEPELNFFQRHPVFTGILGTAGGALLGSYGGGMGMQRFFDPRESDPGAITPSNWEEIKQRNRYVGYGGGGFLGAAAGYLAARRLSACP